MDAVSTNHLRAGILRAAAEGLNPGQIVERLGCARSTVYKVLRAPSPDPRTRPGPRPPRLPPEGLAALRRLAEAYPELSARRLHALALERAGADPDAPPVPSLASVTRVLASLRRAWHARPAPAEGPAVPPTAPDGDANPTAALRLLLREVLDELATADRPERFRLRQQAAVIASALARVHHATPLGAADAPRLSRLLDRVAEEHMPGRRPRPRSSEVQS